MPYVSIVKLALGPLLFVQGRRTRDNAMRLAEAAGERRGFIELEGSKEALNLLFLGDSTMAGVGVDRQEIALASQTAAAVSGLLSCSVRWQLIAKSGIKTSQMVPLTQGESLIQADVLITALGGNDVFAQTKPRRFIEAYETIIDSVLETGTPRFTVVSGLPPLHITPAVPQPLRWFFGICAHRLDRRLRRWVKRRSDVSFVSLQWAADKTKLAVDRFHPGRDLYQEWSYRIALQVALRLRQLPNLGAAL